MTALPAASLILMRDRIGGPPDVLIITRSPTLTFAGGAYVFPGGQVDPQDWVLAEHCCPVLDSEDGASRIAAARETLEETAIAVGHIAEAGVALSANFASRIESGACAFDCGVFTPFARWMPHPAAKRRFDTRFYLAAAPDGVEPSADGNETNAAFWASAENVLARCDAGDGFVLFPTRRLLERIARFPTFAAAREEALRLPDRVITPAIVRLQDGDWLQIPDDAGYPITREPIAKARRN